MTPATKPPKTGKRRVSTIARGHSLTIEQVRTVLGDNALKDTSLLDPDQQIAVASYAAKAGQGGVASRNGSGSQTVVTTRRRQSKGAFEQVRRLGDQRLKLTPADHMTLNLLREVLAGVARRQNQDRVVETRGHDVVVQDVYYPGRWIRMPLAEYQKRKDDKALPPLHERTKEELAEPLSRLSLVNYTCYICTEEMELPHFRGMLEHLLAGNVVLPFKPNHHRALKYPKNHRGCAAILAMMSDVEVNLPDMPEGDAKEALRWRLYRVKLEADGGKLLTEFMASEYKPLSGVIAMARVRAIKEHIKRQRELMS